MKLDMHPLLRGEVDEISFAYDLSVADSDSDLDIGDCLLFADVAFTGPFSVKGEVKNMAGFIELRARVDLSYRTSCARCAKPLDCSLSYELERNVANTQGDVRLENQDNDDYVLIVDGNLDLDAPVLDQLLLEFPMKHLCREDCAGLCPVCGKDRNTGTCECLSKQIDPRFAALKKLLDQGAFSDSAEEEKHQDERED